VKTFCSESNRQLADFNKNQADSVQGGSSLSFLQDEQVENGRAGTG